MKILCGCNSKWSSNKHVRHAGQLLLSGLRNEDTEYLDRWCHKCELFKWIDPSYENMMFDLKNMNY